MAEQLQLTLENEILRVVSCPFFGGKITSFFHKGNSFEAAAQPGKNACKNIIGETAGWEARRHGFARYAYGLDDAFPNIDEEEFLWNGKTKQYPDHGEIWNANFQVLDDAKDFLRIGWESPNFSYRYEKELCLTGNSIKMHYHITNIGKDELPAIWTWHGLMRYEEDMEILLPEGTRQCRNVLAEDHLGKPDTVYPYQNPVYNFAKVPPADFKTAVKYYIEPETAVDKAVSMPVCCGFRYPSKKMRCLLHYNAEKLPYLGVWITAGGFQGDYNCALEPTNGFYDSVSKAAKNHRLPILAPNETMEFELAVSLCPEVSDTHE